MKILHLSTSDLEGGAGRAALRLHRGLGDSGVDSQMLVRSKNSASPTVISDASILTKLGPTADRLYLKWTGAHKAESKFSPQWFPDSIVDQVKTINPDLVHLHWICNGFVSIESLKKIQQPIVWTLHDMWPLTGGCHYSDGCTHYEKGCGKCPQLGSSNQKDLSAQVLNRKMHAWKDLNLTIVTPSGWLADCVRKSSLFGHRRIKVIQNGVDTQIFRPIDKLFARQLLNLPTVQKIILFGAGNPTGDLRKGFSLLVNALKSLKLEDANSYELAILGTEAPLDPIDLGFRTNYLGKLSDEISLALAYSAADVFVAPSKEDNLPNTVVEALACGIPCVAFKVGGMPDLVEHRENGYLAEPFDIADLAKGIQWVLQDEFTHQKISSNARRKAEQKLSLTSHAKRLKSLYEELAT